MTRSNILRGAAICAAAALILPAAAAKPKRPGVLPSLPVSGSKPKPAPAATPAPGLVVSKADPTETVIYSGQPASQLGVTTQNWGGGSAADTTELAYRNTHSLKITTYSLYAGGKITFSKPIDLGDRSPATNRIMQFFIRFGDAASPPPPAPEGDDTNGGAPAGAPGGFPGGRPPGGFPGGGMPGGFPGGFPGGGAYPGGAVQNQSFTGTPGLRSGVYTGGAQVHLTKGGAGGGGGGGRGGAGRGGNGGGIGGRGGFPGGPGFGRPTVDPADQPWQPPVGHIRFLFTLANGAQYDVVRDVPGVGSVDDTEDLRTAWFPVGIPISVLKFPDGAEQSPLQSVMVSGDGYSVTYIGKISLVNDNTPITAWAGDSQDIAAGDTVTLKARAEGGASTLHYSWDFDAADGITEQATGQSVNKTFTKPNESHTVTLTVTDVDGIKKPVVSTTTIKVED